MKLIRSFCVTLALAAVSCSDTTAPPKPAAIKILSGDAQIGSAGLQLAAAPTFVVTDADGHAIDGVPVTVVVSAGGGTIASVPSKTAGGATSVGAWSLGPKVGLNQLSIVVDGLPAATVSATGSAGAPAHIVPATATTINGRVGEPIVPAPSARVTDAFGNPVAGALVLVTFTGGATGPASVPSDGDGNIIVNNWVLGTVAGQNLLTLTAGAATATLTATAAPGDPTQLVTVSGDQQSAKAGTALAAPVVVRILDRYGNGVGGRDASLTVTRGKGTVGSATITSAADGSVTIPWTLGRTAEPQLVNVAVGPLSVVASASVQSDYSIDVRYFAGGLSAEDAAVFTNAAARIRGVVTGDVPDVAISVDVERDCGISGVGSIDERIDDVIVYASVLQMDGPGGILAFAGPCVIRNASGGFHTVIGIIGVDRDDFARMGAQGTLQDVITHEMLHVLGVGSLWRARSLLVGPGTPSVAYLGAIGRQGCVDAGGTAICANTVPVENNGIAGTTDAHWRESVFQSELMTGYASVGGMPFSAITVGSLADLGYLVNPFAADPFRVPTVAAPSAVPGGEGWEKPLPGMVMVSPNGAATVLRRP